PGPNGYGGGLTGVMIDGTTDFEQFFQEPATFPDQIIKLDNVKFTTAAGGGTTVIEFVSNGSPFASNNDGEYLFHTGVSTTPTVETFTVKWTVFNPANFFTGPSQQIGGYLGTGDQSNYLKIVAVQDTAGEVQILLEDNDVVLNSSFIQADDLFQVPDNQKIFFELEIDPSAATATPTVTYELGDGTTNTVSGNAIDLSGTNVLDAILGNYTVQGQTSGLAVGLLASNMGQPEANTFQAIFDDIEITATGDSSSTVLYRVNAGGPEIAAVDGGIAWSADTASNNSLFLIQAGSNNTASFTAVEPGVTVPSSVPGTIFDTERWDKASAPEMQWGFDVPEAGLYEVRLYMGNGFGGTSASGERVFDVVLEGQPVSSFPNLDNIDLSQQFGHQIGGLISNTVNVTDGILNIEFLHDIEDNPLINGIEILQIGDGTPQMPTVSIADSAFTISEADSQIQISLTSNIQVPAGEAVDITFEIVPETATPQLDYEYLSATASFDSQIGVYTDTITIAENLSDVNFIIDILPDNIVENEEAFTVNITGISSNAQIGADTASVTIEDDDSTGNTSTVLYRVNVGGSEIAAVDGGLAWSADTKAINSTFLVEPGSNSTASFAAVEPGVSVPDSTPGAIFDTERWDSSGGAEMQWGFDVPEAGLYEVRLYMGNGWGGTKETGARVFDIALEGSVPNNLNDIDLSSQFGHQVGGLISNTVNVNDGTLNIDFLHGVENPLINGIEIIQLDGGTPSTPTVSIIGGPYTINEADPQVQISLLTDITVPNGEAVDVTFEIIPESATPELDYVYLAGTFDQATGIYTDTLTIAENSSDATFLIDILQDTFTESDEAFTINVTGVSSNAAIGTDTALVTIEDDDSATQNEVSIATTQNAAEPNVDGLFTVSLSEVASTDTVINYSIAGTAIADQDYEALTGTVTIVAGDLSAPIDVVILDDQEVESIEDVIVTLDTITAGDSNILFGTADTATVTIVDDDAPTQNEVSIVTTQNAAEPDVDGLFTVSLSEVASTDTVISYTVAGTAIADQDYEALTETVTIVAGDLSAPIDVTVLDDQEVESIEDVIVTLDTISAGDSNILFGTADTATVTIADDDISGATVLYRVNAGGSQVAAVDGGLAWSADTVDNNSPFLVNPGSNDTASFAAVEPGATVPNSTPGGIFDTERWDSSGGSEMQWAFDVPASGSYEVRLYMGNGWGGTQDPGARVFDLALEGSVPSNLDNVDLSNQFGHLVGGVISNTLTVDDGTLNIEFIHDVQNPLINGIEILQLDA
ncbi:MAG: malectin domain-containing carbohydrate-binding protein, partial [Cyanobacteria bacterium P01_A01_bin.83]